MWWTILFAVLFLGSTLVMYVYMRGIHNDIKGEIVKIYQRRKGIFTWNYIVTYRKIVALVEVDSGHYDAYLYEAPPLNILPTRLKVPSAGSITKLLKVTGMSIQRLDYTFGELLAAYDLVCEIPPHEFNECFKKVKEPDLIARPIGATLNVYFAAHGHGAKPQRV